MIKKIIGTISTRILSALLTLAIVLINGWFLGAGKVGTISLLILALTLIQMLNNFVGGAALVYLFPRFSLAQLLIPAYVWALLICFPGTLALYLIHFIPSGYFWHIMILSLMLSLLSVNFMILMGQERIKAYNMINLFQVLILFGVLAFNLFVNGSREVGAYLTALYASYLFALIAGTWMMLKSTKLGKFKGAFNLLGEIFRYGGVMQAGNIIQFLN
ncbi:MAG: hypothetical protein WCL00_08460, partial [Bacteroidota bacterium]